MKVLDIQRAVCNEILEKISRSKGVDRQTVEKIKREVCEKYGLKQVPSNSALLSLLGEENQGLVKKLLIVKPARSISGVSVIAVMSPPAECPHGRCIYCPGGPSSGSPQSYTGREPAALRGAQNNFDPYMQVQARLKQLKQIGHPVNKVELIIMGGTFPARDFSYQSYFIKRCLDALTCVNSNNLNEAKLNAEKSHIKNVGITFETRPDYCKSLHVDRMLELGATRVEIGVQTIYDDVYHIIKRGHTVSDVVEATRIAKDAGLKVCYHIMPGLPGMSFERDLKMFIELFENDCFKPDMLKIYPCLVLEGTELYNMWRNNQYHPYTTEQLIELLLKVMEMLPPWVRVQRFQRDIPAGLITAGNKKSDLRALLLDRMDELNIKTNEIRYREVGHQLTRYGKKPKLEQVELKIHSYEASEGVEIFLSYEDVVEDILIGFLRMRIPSSKAYRPEVKTSKTALIRELHIFGPELEVGRPPLYEWQHRGYGKSLIAEAELLAEEVFECSRILVTSGLGVREYYRRLGYTPLGPYMCKEFS
ncbi:MAG: tRNA uridine(34) 5-carboxymethylaminomethyl modification radical SAM/GNAT enzyme Elp3 [Candidatus Odinarchaeum yellowstonii]|uniref:tRNA carboxymethyluridine synthase n=1 Tax=Odinarchaeota yellowstonii (strain LCB_4) TaxID=1841599 RepID=A0AAF0D2X0_ODILC|nr:MAG: tRNA uridine(34) 5-carboxymethylaminomethyl modification radical SAM/GNAT enzyme Elp3 [Candidatus Odinarchaeum yellowstonii]